MKKFFPVMILTAAMFFSATPAQAESNLNFVALSYIYNGRVANVSTYLSVRARPSVNSAEVMKIYNGDRLELREDAPGWWQVLSVNGNRFGRAVGQAIGYVSETYVQVD